MKSKQSTEIFKSGTPMCSVQDLKTNANLSDLFHKIGHEIGNPLTSIISFASIMERSTALGSEQNTATVKFADYAKSISAEAWKVSLLSERIVALMSERSGNPSVCNLTDVAHRAMSKLASRFNIKDIDFEINSVFEDSTSFIDREQAVALFLELMLNAALAIKEIRELDNFEQLLEQDPSFDTIAISIKKSDLFTSFIISNKISKPHVAELCELFHPFMSTFHENRGLGLGLTVAQAIVERFGGKIELQERTLDGISTFSVLVMLPTSSVAIETDEKIQEENRISKATTEIAKTGGATKIGSLNLLIIDDERTVASAIEKIVTFCLGEGTKIQTKIVNGHDAMKLIREKAKFDLILCDYNLDGTNGKAIFDLIALECPEQLTKLAFITGERVDNIANSPLAGCERPILFKPFEPEQLLELINEIFASSR
jgi:nitrogen-specific signal transduction histidine kinase